jgi:ADP-heptose:LPS heptosyltransferase
LKRALFSLIGPSRRRSILAARVRKRSADSAPFTFPIDRASFKRILLILPEDRLQVLLQIPNAAAIVRCFPDARVTLLAESSAGPLAAMMGGGEIVGYASADKLLFSPAFDELCERFRGEADCCCLLAREDDDALLYLAGLTDARLRVGYGGSADFPFINLRVDPGPDNPYLPESNCAMAEALGATRGEGPTWTSAEETTAEIDHLLREVRLDGAERLFGIDVLSLFTLFGDRGAEECISALLTSVDGGVYFYGGDELPRRIAARCAAMVPPLFSSLPVPQTTALLRRTECIVAGNSLLFGLAMLLAKKAVGIFSESDLPLYCKPSLTVKGIPGAGRGGNAETVTAVVQAVRELGGR